MIILKKGKVAITVTIIVIVILLLGCTGAFYALSEGTFDPAKVTNLFTDATTEPSTESSAEKATEPPTQALPELSATISSQTLDLTESQTAQITAELKKGDKEKCNIRYSTSDENIAAIDAKGLITPMSKGECQVGVYIEGYETTVKNFTVTVDDYRIEQINILNEYLFNLNTKETYTYAGSKTGNARLTGCKIDDFNNDGSYELFLIYKMANDFQKVQVVTVIGGTAYIGQTDKSYSDIVGGGYSTYIEDIYIDGNGSINIISEYTKTDSIYTEKTTLLYSTGSSISQMAKYYSKEPFNIGDMSKKSEYKIDETVKTRDEFTSLYTSLKTSRELFDDYISITATLSQGNYTKAEMPASLGSAYYNRIKWITSDEGVAKVGETGVITGGSKVGSCTITGTIDGISAPMCKVTVESTAVSNEFNSYIEEIRDDYIIGEAGNKMSLYGYYITDIDMDGTTDLLLYYTGGNGCQLEIAHFVGSQVSRQVVKSVVTENGVACMFDLFVDSMNGNATVLYVGNVSKADSTMTTDFHYETYSGGAFVSNTSEYTVITSSGNSQYKVGGETVEQDSFNTMLNRYRKLGDWVVLN